MDFPVCAVSGCESPADPDYQLTSLFEGIGYVICTVCEGCYSKVAEGLTIHLSLEGKRATRG